MKLTRKQRETLFKCEDYFKKLAKVNGNTPTTVGYYIEISPVEEISVEGYELTISPNEALQLIANPELIEEVE
ncbi:hypothetical protein LNP00_06595 [Fructobacillus sp. M158]|uniref:hypothetical protein n=1 Tax=Fructobacillus parabroussonetiae TaxID=2713174 RepID=UPI00200A068B|nr:hypothetical protein [Fructobacillus parabroussonetiae]MCK8618014.1 hypothetical protein [Fructobacillus parabroussonetiae]